MSSRLRLKLTAALCGVGMLLMVLSYPVARLGGASELYPFFYWRLYSNPPGWKGGATYRIYTKQAGVWQRRPVQANRYFSRSEYAYFLNRRVNLLRDDSTNQLEWGRLESFVHLSYPGIDSFQVFIETFDPLEVLSDTANYERTPAFDAAQ